MSKRDRIRRARRRKEQRALREEFAVATLTREPNGRLTRPAPRERQTKPTPEYTAARLAALPNGKGEMSDWIDSAEAHQLLSPLEAEAIRRYRAIVKVFLLTRAAPRMTSGTIGKLAGGGGAPGGPGDEDAARRARADLDDADAALKQANWRDAETLGNCVRERGLPTSRQMEQCRRAAAFLVTHFGLAA